MSNLPRRILPPTALEKAINYRIIEPLADTTCWHPAYNRIWRNVTCHYGPGANDCTMTHSYTCNDHCCMSDPNIITYISIGSMTCSPEVPSL